MRFVRVSTDYGINVMKDHLLSEPDLTNDQIAQGVREYLAVAPDKVFFMSAWEETPDATELYGFMLAYAPDNCSHVFIHQAWSKPGTETAAHLFYSLHKWAIGLGRSQFRCETLRAPEAFFRRWGFEELSRVLKLDITEGWEDRLLTKIGDTNEPVQQQQTTEDQEHIDSYQTAEANLELARAAAGESGGPVSDPVLGPDCPGPAPAVPSCDEHDWLI